MSSDPVMNYNEAYEHNTVSRQVANLAISTNDDHDYENLMLQHGDAEVSYYNVVQ